MALADTTPDSTPLDDATAFFTAMRSTHGRVPALKRLGRFLLRWLCGGAVFVALVAAGNIAALGARVASDRYVVAWLVTVAAIPLVPLAFVAIMSAVELGAVRMVVVPILLVSRVLGRRASGIAKKVFLWGFLGFLGAMVAGTAHNFAADSGGQAASSRSQPASVPGSSARPRSATSSWFSYSNVAMGALFWLGGVASGAASKTLSDFFGVWMKRTILSPRRRGLLYDPSGRVLGGDDPELDQRERRRDER